MTAHAFWRIMGRFRRNGFAIGGLVVLTIIIAAALTAPVFYPADSLRIVGPPSIWPLQDSRFPLGTDALGRDMLAMIVQGARTTLAIGVCASLTALVVGVTVGSLAGFYGGWIGNLFGRLIELFQIMPGLIFIMAVVSLLGSKNLYIVLAIGLLSWDSIARLTRAEVMAWRRRDFVLACRSMGMGELRLLFGEILPNALAPVVAVATFSVAGAILIQSALSFLELDDPTVPTWGRLAGEGRELIRTAWYISALPGLAIVITVVALGLVSDGLNEAINRRTGR